VQEFLPHMLERRDGAVLTAQGGMPTVDPEHLADLLWTMHGT
jgi:CTP:molybdopterin cytidylyltransferase MocA